MQGSGYVPMEERLENFVNLLNRQRQTRAVPQELAKLPNWAQRELSKHRRSARRRAKRPPVNGTSHDDKPKPEIVVSMAKTRRAAGAEGGNESRPR